MFIQFWGERGLSRDDIEIKVIKTFNYLKNRKRLYTRKYHKLNPMKISRSNARLPVSQPPAAVTAPSS